MKKKEKEFFCDICGNTCNAAEEEWNKDGIIANEFAILEAKWGYCSRKDQSHHKCIMCENCFDEIAFFIEHILKGKMPHAYYNMMTMKSDLDFIERDEDDDDTKGLPESERTEGET